MRLETKRLILRDLTINDAKDITENINNFNVSRYLLVVPYPYHFKDAKKWIKSLKRNSKKKLCEDYVFGITLKPENKIIGAVGLHKIDKFQGTAEIGYWLGENYWRQGIMSEAVKEVINFSFLKLKLRKIWVGAFSENKASNNLIQKMGFKKEGYRREHLRSKATGKIHDDVFYGLLKREWKNNYSKTLKK